MSAVRNHIAPGSAFDGDLPPLEWFQDDQAAQLSPDDELRLRAYRKLSQYCRKKANQPDTPTMWWISRAERAERAAPELLKDF